jgi:hypothetical protein
MPLFIKPFFRKPFKLFAIDADTGQPLDPNVHRKTRVTYYELANSSNDSKKLVAHKSASNIAKEGGEEGKAEDPKPAEGEEAKKEGSKKGDSKKEGSKKEDAPKEGSKKGNEAKVEQKGDDVAWTPDEDEKLKAMKDDGKTWAQISVEMGRHKGQLTVRWKEIKAAGSNDQGKMPGDGKGGDGDKGQKDKEKQGGGGQGKQGKKGKKGGDNQQNHQQNNKKNENKKDNNKSTQDKKEAENKPASKKEEATPASKPSSNKPASKAGSNNANNETRFTMTDWLTLQEDDMFSFGELQCLSELIGKDLGQSWQRVAAKFFDLTGRRIHPDDVRDKFERMAVMAQGGK